MSRCFPYPPPGHALSRASKDTLIESIKFQNERVVISKEQKKEKRREKKEKRKEKTDKIKQNPEKSCLVFADPKAEFLSKGNKARSEQQLEGSTLTEEHGKAVCLLAPSTSSDSTENSNKRKRPSSPDDVTRGQGKKIIRIRLPLKKQIQSDASGSEQQPCSTSGRSNVPSQHEGVTRIGNREDREQICSTSQPIETFVKRNIPNPPVTNAVMTPMQRAELQYMSLMDSLVVPPQHLDLDDDLDWLLKSKNRESFAERKRISGNDRMSCSTSWGLWPRAQYLQEADVYALPFTVPF